jgi:hypothetical protein
VTGSRLGGALAVAVLLALVAGVGWSFVDHSAPPAGTSSDEVRGDPSVMSAAAADELEDALAGAGWDCYASLPSLTRCFRGRAVGEEGHARAEVAVTLTGRGTVGRVSIAAAGSLDDGAHRQLAGAAAVLVGDALLGEQGEVLADRVGRLREVQVAGQDVRTSSRDATSVTLVVQSPTFEPVELPGPDLPSPRELRDAATGLGLACSPPGPTVSCSDPGTGPARSLTTARAGGRTTTVALSAASPDPDDAGVLTAVLQLVRATGLGGDEMLGWLREHGGEDLARGDVGGVHVSVRRGASPVHTTVYATFGRIYA